MKHDESPPTDVAACKTVFLTGGSGLLGAALLESIRITGVIALYHRSPITHAGIKKGILDYWIKRAVLATMRARDIGDQAA